MTSLVPSPNVNLWPWSEGTSYHQRCQRSEMGIDTSYANYLKNLAVVPYAANNVELEMIHTGLVCWARTQSHEPNGYMTSLEMSQLPWIRLIPSKCPRRSWEYRYPVYEYECELIFPDSNSSVAKGPPCDSRPVYVDRVFEWWSRPYWQTHYDRII